MEKSLLNIISLLLTGSSFLYPTTQVSTHQSSYRPAKLAFKVFVPSTGIDDSLNPIIFLHGLTEAKESWIDIPQIVADGTKRRVYAVDSRNHGDSEYCDVFNFNVNVDDLFHFMDTIKIPKAIIVGHSMGGRTTMGAALRKPEMIEMIIVEDMVPRVVTKEDCESLSEEISLQVAIIRSIPGHLSDSEVIKFFLDYIFENIPEKDLPFIKTPDLYKMMIPFIRKEDGTLDVKFDVEGVLKSLRDCANLTDKLSGQYDGPAHFIYGESSYLLVGDAKEDIKKLFPKVEFAKFKNASHFLHMEYPKEFSKKVVSICSKL